LENFLANKQSVNLVTVKNTTPLMHKWHITCCTDRLCHKMYHKSAQMIRKPIFYTEHVQLSTKLLPLGINILGSIFSYVKCNYAGTSTLFI